MKARILIGILISMLLISCKLNRDGIKKVEINQNIHRKWMLIQFEDFKKEEIIEKKCFLDLTNTAYASAEMGCNTLGFEYDFKEDKTFSVSKVLTTHMYCEENRIEGQFLNSLAKIESYKIEGHKLFLITTTKKEIVFVAEDWD
jgi:heat shock protein HslJ